MNTTANDALPSIIGVIPVRYESARLPGKALLEIAGKPMIYWVYKNAFRYEGFTQLLVASDSPKILDYCKSEDIPAMETGEHRSGSDRLYEVLERTKGELYVNIQGDEPTVRRDHIELMLSPFLESDVPVTTLKVEISAEAARNPNAVKVVTDKGDRALYFSRAPIPYNRESTTIPRYFKHLGLYAYRREALEKFHSLPPSELEQIEKLEQLRFLENGIPIIVKETKYDTIGVDTQEDLDEVRKIFKTQKRPSKGSK